MIQGIDAFYPKSGVLIHENKGSYTVTMYSDVQKEEVDGEEKYTANIVSFVTFSKLTEEQVVAEFDYYFNKALEEELKIAKEKAIAPIEALLTDSDYKAHKVFDGVLTEEEYRPWKELREVWRGKINEIRNAKTYEEVQAVTYKTEP